MNSSLNRFVGFVAPVWLVACAEHDDVHDHEVEEDPGEHACEALEAGNAMTLAGATDRADAPLLEQGEAAYEISLDDTAPRYVRLLGPTDGLLFADVEDVVTALYQEDGVEDLLPRAEANEFCRRDVPEHFDLELDAGDYFLELSPSAISPVWLLFTTAEGHAHEE